MDKIDISVLVPIYGVEEYIEKCAHSLFNQSLKENIEFIFVNDCSHDSSMDILYSVMQEYPNRASQVKVINHSQNGGLAKSRNSALDNAVGKYVYIIDSDDWLLQNDALEKLLSKAEDNNADIVEANYCKVSHKAITKVDINRDYSSKEIIIKDIICKNTPITIWNKLIKKKLYDDNAIRVPEGINNGEDYVTLPKLMLYANKIIKDDSYIYAYNQLNINSFASNRTNWNNLDSMIEANRHLKEFFSKKAPIFVKDIERMYIETKAYHLLYSHTKEELAIARSKFLDSKSQYFFNIRWKYQVILMLNALRLDRIILRIGKVFRRRGYVNK